MRDWMLLSLLILSGCGNKQKCSSKILEIAHDGGSARYASTEVRNCGATTGYSTIVRVGQDPRPALEGTGVLVADDNHGEATSGGAGSIWMHIAWKSPGKLDVAYASHARVFKSVRSIEGATITFRPSEPMTLPPVP